MIGSVSAECDQKVLKRVPPAGAVGGEVRADLVVRTPKAAEEAEVGDGLTDARSARPPWRPARAPPPGTGAHTWLCVLRRRASSRQVVDRPGQRPVERAARGRRTTGYSPRLFAHAAVIVPSRSHAAYARAADGVGMAACR